MTIKPSNLARIETIENSYNANNDTPGGPPQITWSDKYLLEMVKELYERVTALEAAARPEVAKAAPEDTENRQPDFRLDVYLVEYGYAARWIFDGEQVGFECRDFGGDYTVEKLRDELSAMSQEMLQDFRLNK